MKPKEFVDKWSAARVGERQGSHEHFTDLCRLLGEETPVEADPKGDWYCFERGAAKTGGGDGWADVWKQSCFAWEYKGRHKDLNAALKQLKLYQGALANPPLLIVSDMERIEVHTAFTNMVQERHVFALEDMLDANIRRRLKNIFSEAGAGTFKPQRKRAELTAKIAGEFVEIAKSLRQRKHPADKVAHFVNRMVFCMFAEDVDLLPDKIFTKLLQLSLKDPAKFQKHAQKLFSQMREGGDMDMLTIEWFNGGLFDDGSALPLEKADIERALAAAKEDWSSIDPSIMGTLFERGLDPDKRSQLGAHYTDPEKIMMIVRPVIIEPLSREWDGVKAQIVKQIDEAPKATKDKLLRGADLAARTRALKKAEELHRAFIDRLKAFRILDPACGSGNFLFLGLKALKDIEHRVNTECEAMGLPRGFPAVGPENMLGIEINPFAAELARVSVWIGEIQWMREHGFDASRNPILKPLETIACHDALLDDKQGEYKWPKTDVIIGNPPFLGGKLLRDNLGHDTVERMFRVYEGRVSAEADLVCYWFARAREKLDKGEVGRVGLVSTNSIRGGANREVLDGIEEAGRIFEAWSDEPWVIDGAAVRVAIVCFDGDDGRDGLKLNGEAVAQINSDLTSSSTNLTQVARLKENISVAFMGDTKGGAFDIEGDLARQWLKAPRNPNGKTNSYVLRPWVNGMDVTRRLSDKWIVDFRWEMDEEEAAKFELPFRHVFERVKPERLKNNRELYARFWWRHVEARQGMWAAIGRSNRYLATVRHSKHRLFRWFERVVCPDSALIAVARDDDTAFGVLHSRMHEVWSLGLGSSLEDRPRYTPSTTFETFPFPVGLTPDIAADDYADDPRARAIADAARKLNDLREAWLNPEDLVRREKEVVAGYPDRILPKNEAAEKELKKRTLTNLYNDRPAWLDNAHRALDAAVAAAYGWKDWGKGGLSDEVILARLFKLNQDRAKV